MGAIFGTITGVIFELQLMGDASKQVAQDQAKLNQLQEAGLEGTKEYSQAEQALAKDHRFLEFSSRNLAAAVANFVPELLMVTSMLSKGGGVMKLFSGGLGGLTTGFKTLTGTITPTATATTAFTGALANMNSVSGTGISALGGLKGALLGLLGPFALAAGAAALIISHVQQLQDKMDEVGLKYAKGGGALDTENFGKGMAQFDEVRKHAGPTSVLEELYQPQQVKDRYTKGGGQFDSKGEILSQVWETGHQGSIDTKTRNYMGDLIKAQQPLDKLVTSLKNSGHPMEDITAAISEQQIKVGQITDDYYEWGAAMNPANTIIETLRKSVMSGVMPQERLGQAIDEQIDTMKEQGRVTDSNAGAVEYLANQQLKALIPGTQKSAAAAKAAKKDESEYTKAVLDANKTLADRSIENTELLATEKTLNDAFGTKQNLMHADIGIQEEMAKIINENKYAYVGEELALMKVADAHKILTPLMREQIQNHKDDTTAMTEDIASNIDWNKAQTDSATNAKLVAQGRLAAALSMEEFVNGLVSGKAQMEWETSMLSSLADSFGIQLPIGIKVSNEQLKTIITTMKMGGNEMKLISDLIEHELNKHLERFGEIIGSVDMKAFNKSWKELDFGSVPKKVRGAFKGMFEDMREVTERGQEFGTAWDMIITSIITGTDKVSTGDRKKVFREMGDDLDRIAKIDPEAKGLNEAILKPLMKLKGEKFDEALLKNANSIDMINEAMANGDISGAEYLAIMKENTVNAGEASASTDELQQKVSKLVEQYNSGKINAQQFSEKMDALGVSTGTTSPKVSELEQALKDMGLGGVEVRAKVDLVSGAIELLGTYGTATAGVLAAAFQNIVNNEQKLGSYSSTIFDGIASSAKKMGGNVRSATDGIVGSFQVLEQESKTLLTKLENSFSAITSVAKKWSGNMRSSIDAVTGAMELATSQAKSLQTAIGNLKDKDITVTTTFKYKTEGSPPSGAKQSGFKIDNADNPDASVLTRSVSTRQFSSSDNQTSSGGGPYVFNINVKGSELVPEQRMTKYIRKVSGNKIPSMM